MSLWMIAVALAADGFPRAPDANLGPLCDAPIVVEADMVRLEPNVAGFEDSDRVTLRVTRVLKGTVPPGDLVVHSRPGGCSGKPGFMPDEHGVYFMGPRLLPGHESQTLWHDWTVVRAPYGKTFVPHLPFMDRPVVLPDGQVYGRELPTFIVSWSPLITAERDPSMENLPPGAMNQPDETPEHAVDPNPEALAMSWTALLDAVAAGAVKAAPQCVAPGSWPPPVAR